MTTEFAPYTLRSFRPKRADLADNGYTASLARAGTTVATIDCGQSPDDDDLVVEFTSQAELEFFKAFAERRTRPIDEMQADERFLRDLAEATYHAGRLMPLCRQYTLFRTRQDPLGVWRQVRAPFRPALASALRQRFAGDLEFANERFA